VVTEDEYILSLWRVTRPDQNVEPTERPILYISVNSEFAAENFMIHGPDLSPAFYFYNQGYDVFVNNLRGTTYSRRHQTLNPDVDREFWAINFDSLEIDQRANIQYILDLTQQQHLYVYAHAIGATAMLIGMSFNPDWYNQRVITAALLSPFTSVEHTQSPTNLFFIQFPQALELLRKFALGEIFSHTFVISMYDDIVCVNLPIICILAETLTGSGNLAVDDWESRVRFNAHFYHGST
jgi:hypothetical protein